MSEDVASREEKLRASLVDAQETIMEMQEVFGRLLASPLVYGTVVSSKNEFNLDAFEKGDMMMVLDKQNHKDGKFGRIVSSGVDKGGNVKLQMTSGVKKNFNIGLHGKTPEVKLLEKDDGTNVTILVSGLRYEVHGLPGKTFRPTETVKVNMETKQIHDTAGITDGGDVANVISLIDETHCEVDVEGRTKVVLSGVENHKPGDRVMLDPSHIIVIRKLEKANKDRFTLRAETNVSWDDIAGIPDAKMQIRECIEDPYLHPEIYEFYNKKPRKGALLYGPPGCGKTLLGKAVATCLSRLHGKENIQSGFIYVKGPELLSMWVGNAEAQIRSLFERGREHFDKNGYPATLFIDEADAIIPMRGTGKSSDVNDTIVPMFLSEMDGLDHSHVFVLLATNRPGRLDPAACREGRCDRHIKVGRPTPKSAPEYFKIHLEGVPLAKDTTGEEVAQVTTSDLFDTNRVLYRLKSGNKSKMFTLGDALSGAMIANVIDLATTRSMKRDLANKTRLGVGLEDFGSAVDQTYRMHFDVNHTFDLEDFCDSHGMQTCNLQVEKLRSQ